MKILERLLGGKPTVVIGMLTVFFILMSCGTDDSELELPPETQEEEGTEEPTPQPEPEGLFADVLKLGSIPNVVPANSTDTLSTTPTDPKLARQLYNGNLEEVRFGCSDYDIEKASSQNSFPIWGEPSAVLYPGSFVQGNSIAQGTPTAIPAKRAGGSLILTGADQSLLGTVALPEFSNTQVSLGRNELLSGFGPTPTPFQMDVLPIANASHLAYELGLSQADFEAYVANGLEFDQTAGVTSFLVGLQQFYYGVDYELSLGMEGYFDADVSPADLEPYVTESNPAAFVSKVRHGRQFYILLETTTFANTAKEIIQGAFSSFDNAMEGTIDVDMLNNLEALSIKVAVRTNNAQGPYEEVGPVGLSALSDLVSEPIVLATAQPLSYEIRSLAQPDNKAGYTLNVNFNLALCQLEGALPPNNFRPLMGLFDDGVGAAFMFSRGHIVVFNGAGTSYAWLNVTTGEISPIYGIKDTNGLLPVIDAEYVTAAYHSSWDLMYIIDQTGNTAELYRNNLTLPSDQTMFPAEPPVNMELNSTTGERFKIQLNGAWQKSNASPEIANLLDSGIGAALYVERVEDTDPSDASSFSFKYNFFQKEAPGRWIEMERRFANRQSSLFYEGIYDLNTWAKNRFPFDEIGAACALELENRVMQQVYFNGEGTQFFIANSDEELVAGPYLLY